MREKPTPGHIILVVDLDPQPLPPVLMSVAPVGTRTTVAAPRSAFARSRPRLTIPASRPSEALAATPPFASWTGNPR